MISLKNFKNNPLLQATFALGFAVLCQLFWYYFLKFRHNPLDPEDIWMLCPVFLMLYILFNILSGFNQKEIKSYYSNSIYGFILFLGLDIGLCSLLTQQSIFEVTSISRLIFVFGMVYLVFLSILNLIRFIVQLVLKQDQKMEEDYNNNNSNK